MFTACCSSGSNRFHKKKCLDVPPEDRRSERKSLHIETFRFEMFRINATFIYSTANGNRPVMKSGRVVCRPIEGEDILT